MWDNRGEVLDPKLPQALDELPLQAITETMSRTCRPNSRSPSMAMSGNLARAVWRSRRFVNSFQAESCPSDTLAASLPARSATSSHSPPFRTRNQSPPASHSRTGSRLGLADKTVHLLGGVLADRIEEAVKELAGQPHRREHAGQVPARLVPVPQVPQVGSSGAGMAFLRSDAVQWQSPSPKDPERPHEANPTPSPVARTRG